MFLLLEQLLLRIRVLLMLLMLLLLQLPIPPWRLFRVLSTFYHHPGLSKTKLTPVSTRDIFFLFCSGRSFVSVVTRSFR
jgi:hypothetical protein